MRALLWRDIRLAFTSGSTILTALVFFFAIITMTPFGVGPDKIILARIGPGMIWIAALLSILLGLERLFQTDLDDGALDILRMNENHYGLSLIVFIKCVAHWTSTVLPLIIVSPALGLMLNLDTTAILFTTTTLLLGTPALTLIGSVGAALAASLPRGSMLISIIILPLSIPVMIFGVSTAYAGIEGLPFLAPMLFLVALSLFFGIIGPFAAACALKYLSE